MKIEIERKFLLKTLPQTSTPVDSIKIDQYYLKNSAGIWERARTWESVTGEIKYIHTIKKSVLKGVNIEDENLISKKEFLDFKKRCHTSSDSKSIQKVRHIYPDNGLYWEVDEFSSGYKLIIAEIEIPQKNYKLLIPKFIEEVSLLEVTGLKQFSNRSLSIKMEKSKLQKT